MTDLAQALWRDWTTIDSLRLLAGVVGLAGLAIALAVAVGRGLLGKAVEPHWLAALACALILLGALLQLLAITRPLAELLDQRWSVLIWRYASDTVNGRLLAAVIIGSALMIPVLLSRAVRGAGLIATVFAVAALVHSLAGHGVSLAQGLWPVVLHALHLAAALAWLGVLIWLAWPHPPRLREWRMRRLGQDLLVLVGILLASGLAVGWLHGVRPNALLDDAYSQTVLLKSLVLAAALLLAAANRWVLQSRQRHASAGWVRTIVRVETAIVIGAIALAVVLTQLAPPAH